MGIFAWFSNKKRELRLDDLDLDKLKREQISWEQKLTNEERSQERFAKEELALKNEYAAAETETSKNSIARRILKCRQAISGSDIKIKHYNKMADIAFKLIIVKESIIATNNESVIGQIPVDQLNSLMENIAVESRVNDERTRAMIDSLTNTLSGLGEGCGDADLEGLKKALDAETKGIQSSIKGSEADAEIARLREQLTKESQEGAKQTTAQINSVRN